MVTRFPLALVFLGAASAWGQNAISAHSGMIHYVEGTVMLEGQPVEPKFAEFPEVKNNQTLCTEQGRAEVLLTPGVFLRLSEGSSFRMLSNQLSNTSLEVVSGSALIEVDELLKDNAIDIQFKGGTVALSKKGLYRFDSDLSRLRVYDGEVSATVGEQSIVAKRGKEIAFDATLRASNFDSKDSDPFLRWASRRAEYINTANVSAARSAGSLGLLASSSFGSWAWNPWYGMFTYLPGMGYGYSPFGYYWYSPLTVGNFYNNYYGYGNVANSGYNGGAYNGGGVGRATTSVYTNTNTGETVLAPQRGGLQSSGASISAPAGSGSPSFASGSAGVSSPGVSRSASMGGGAGAPRGK